MSFLFTSESVSAGHPDKLCDQISDHILDALLTRDPYAHGAIETLATTDRVIVAGETKGPQLTALEVDSIVRDVVRHVGYEQEGFHWQTLKIENFLHAQSQDIARGVNLQHAADWGAGDQGIMFGYACRETETFMPATLYYAHRILESLHQARMGSLSELLGPDAKSQVTLNYDNGVPVSARAIVVSTQHHPDVSQEKLRAILWPIVSSILPHGWMCAEKDFWVNPTGRFVVGGPVGDCGLTGRKIIVDTYGGAAPHGGGAFSGKDPTKVDRSAAYMARYVAKNIVAAHLADRCTVQLSYVIGHAQPLSIYVNTHGTGRVEDEALAQFLIKEIDFSPKGICQQLQLNRPIYAPTASYGHFGREATESGHFSWEKLDLLDVMQALSIRHGDMASKDSPGIVL